MAAWGEALSPQARADVQALVDAGLAAGRSALAGAEVIVPIPVLVATSGQVLTLSFDGGGLSLPEQAEHAVAALRKAATAARAVGLVTTTAARGKGEVLEVWAEHAEGAALLLRQPYRRSLLGGVVEFEALAAYPGERRIWPAAG